MDLRCRKTGCKFNKDLTCTANGVDIGLKQTCMTFQSEKGKEIEDFSSKIFSDNPPKVADYRHLKNIGLKCNAKCLFNRNGHCISNGITINAATTVEPKCITFMKP